MDHHVRWLRVEVRIRLDVSRQAMAHAAVEGDGVRLIPVHRLRGLQGRRDPFLVQAIVHEAVARLLVRVSIELDLLDRNVFHLAEAREDGSDHTLRDGLSQDRMERDVNLCMRRRSSLDDRLLLHDGRAILVLHCPAESIREEEEKRR